MTPFKLTPAFRDYLWGGERLKTDLGKISDMQPLAESWELSCHPNGQSIVATGPAAGMTLGALVQASDRTALLGTNASRFSFFPVLVKLIDAKQALSIQVHPSDEYALAHENSYGKTEMWYVLDALPDSFIYYGVNRPIDQDALRAAIAENRLEELLGKRPVKKGDVVFIPAGTIHAIGAGLLVCEVQQNSDLTYRVYDFGRRGPDGTLRELHVDKALAVSSLTPSQGDFAPAGAPRAEDGAIVTLLSACAYFTAERVQVAHRGQARTDGSTFHATLCVEGAGTLRCGGTAVPFSKGESVFVPADAGDYVLEGACDCVRTSV